MTASESHDRRRGDQIIFSPDSFETRGAEGAASEREISLLRITELMVLSALREQDTTALADLARRRAEFLADASLRFGSSLDEDLTYHAIAGLKLPGLQAWCVVDIVEVGGGLQRIAILHPDEGKRQVTQALCERWRPAHSDPIGIPALGEEWAPVVITDDIDETLAAAARGADALRVIQWLGTGPILIVPITAHNTLLGAITYVNAHDAPVYTAEDVAFAVELAARCAQALESARLYATARVALAEASEALTQAEVARSEAVAARAAAESARISAEAANATKMLFLRTISHELRTPLHAIGGYAQMLALGVRGPVTSEQATDLESIRRCELHLLGLVNSVLSYAQLEAGRVSLVVSTFPLSDVVSGAQWLVDPQLREKELHYTFEGTVEPMVIRADEEKVRQIVLNLLGNAIKFTSAGGAIAVTLARAASTVRAEHDGIQSMARVQVRDTGIGIAADKTEHIFDPFVQVDERFPGSEGGVGLGLAISRELTRLMGGELTVTSVLGEGSTFTLDLPLVQTI